MCMFVCVWMYVWLLVFGCMYVNVGRSAYMSVHGQEQLFKLVVFVVKQLKQLIILMAEYMAD